MTRRRRIVLGVFSLVVVAFVAVVVSQRGKDRSEEVRTELVERRELTSVITATGSVRPRRQVNISSDVMGRVVELTVEEGDEVEVGKVLLRIDPSALETQVARARAALAQTQSQASQARSNLLQAERDRDRLEGLRATDPDLVSRQALEEVQTRVEVQRAALQSAEFGTAQARAQLAEAEEQMSRTTIRSPISGRVTRLNIETGETAVIGTMNNPGSLLLTVSDLSEIEAVLTVDETDLPRITLGDSATVELDAFPDQRLRGVVTRMGNSAIQGATPASRASVDFEVVLTLLDAPEALRPDLSASADIVVDRRSGVLAVPIISVTLRAEDPENPTSPRREGVFVVRDGKAVWTPVEIGITGEAHFEVLSGLEAGDRVVSGPYQLIQSLKDGAAVRLQAEGRSGSLASDARP
jgi:HlyD family secretion protein